MEDNSHAGQGPVVLDIGGEVGALIVRTPVELTGAELEARPVAGRAFADYAGGHLPHVAVLARDSGPTAVFGALQEGEYELNVRPHEPPRLRVSVRGGEVSTAAWPP